MLEGVIALYTGSFYSGGAIGNAMEKLAQLGFFSYLLPFLLLFALVFGILVRIGLFRTHAGSPNIAVDGIIAFATALLALQLDFVPQFFSQIFPRMGVGLAIILAVIIILGIVTPGRANWPTYIFFGIGVIIFLVVVNNSFDILGWGDIVLSDEMKTLIVVLLGMLVFVGVVIGAANPSDPNSQRSILTRLMDTGGQAP
jgi:hypothetical protein